MRWPAALPRCVGEMPFSRCSLAKSRTRSKGHSIGPGVRTGAYVVIFTFMIALSRIAAAGDQNAAIGGPFALIDQNGHQVADADFRGKFMLIYFGYTSCPDVCPTTLFAIGQAMAQLAPDERKQVVPIFITVDPERDTQKVLADYVAYFSPELVGLTGLLDAVQAVEREYHVYAKKHLTADGSYSVDHSSIIYLIDRAGKYRATLTADSTPAQIVDGLRKLF
jgi:cytochrome oxidase Cu insertion factor (SCO1/SenC/PrrC family)